MVNPEDVTACLVTRGDQPRKMAEIIDSLIFGEIVVWDNSQRPRDLKTYGRYAVIEDATSDVIFFQDDDVIVPQETQEALCREYEPGVVVAVYGHGENDGGYGDLPLVCGGAILDRDLPAKAEARYLEHWPIDDGYLYDCDFVLGVLYDRWRHIHEPFLIDYPIAQHPSRLVNQPWQADLKYEMTQRARAIRDASSGREAA